MSVSVKVGDATIIAVSDQEQAYPAAGVFPDVTEAQWAAYRDTLTADGKILLNFGCYIIHVDGRTVLVDTGWGPAAGGALMDDIAAAGVAPASVDLVIFTHLHGDHIGWNLVMQDGKPQPRFANARYLVPEADFRHYSSLPEPPGLFQSQVVPLQALGVMDLVGGDHVLTPSVTSVATPGHTPGHLSLAIVSGRARGFILGDVALSTADVHETSWRNTFDWNSDIARGTRDTVLARLESDGSLIGASHLPKPGLGRLVRVDGRRVWRPV